MLTVSPLESQKQFAMPQIILLSLVSNAGALQVKMQYLSSCRSFQKLKTAEGIRVGLEMNDWGLELSSGGRYIQQSAILILLVNSM
jgi:hypothetical protein